MKTLRPQPGPQENFLASPADIVIYGGAAGGGKTFALLMEALRHVGNGGFGAVIFRRTSVQVRTQGGLWDTAEEIYPGAGGIPVESRLYWMFPSGAKVAFAYLQYEQDKHNYQGSQIPLIGFDELTHFSESQFFFFFSRNRSMCGVKPYIRATCNPDESSWVATLIAWWIDQETGLPIPERAGVVRWFVRVNGTIEWADSADELVEKFGAEFPPKSLTFIPATVEDNKALMDANPEYIANLRSLPFVEQARLLGGNWKVADNEGAYWGRNPEYFESHIWAEGWPNSFEWTAMCCDPSLGRTNRADPSAIVNIGYTSGTYYVDADIKVRTVDQLVSDYVDRFAEHAPDIAGWEDVAFQTIGRRLVDIECGRRNIPVFPIAEVSPCGVDKVTRIKRLGPYLASQKIRIRQNEGGRILYNQLRSFGVSGAHDDGPDGVEQTLRLLRAYSNEMAGGQ